MEIYQHILTDSANFNSLAQSIIDLQGQVLQQSQIEQKLKVEHTLIQNILPIYRPLNLFKKKGIVNQTSF